MLDLNIFKWSNSQRLMLVSYIITIKFCLFEPYATIKMENYTREFMGSHNILRLAVIILTGITISYCYGKYTLNTKPYVIAIPIVVFVDIFQNILSIARDGRHLTLNNIWFILALLATLVCFWYDYTHYKYPIVPISKK